MFVARRVARKQGALAAAAAEARAHVEAIQVLEHVREEPNHQLVVLPAAHELLEHRLVVPLLDPGQDACGEVVLDCLAIVVVQVL